MNQETAAHVYIGTSGWNYDAWGESLYAGRARREWLQCYAAQFDTVEVNATFYRLQRVATFQRWRQATPAGFRFAIKANRYLTHSKKLSDPAPSIRLERSRAAGLGEKLAVVVWQLPRNFRWHGERIVEFARALARWPDVRHAIEFRHPSWFHDAIACHLHRSGIAVCLSDAADWPLWEIATTDFVYVRLHGHEVTYASGYPAAQLLAWAQKIRSWLRQRRDVYVYFDNDALGHAPRDARRLRALLA
jgi:uncharacterized protein YecE (DUF72 family)